MQGPHETPPIREHVGAHIHVSRDLRAQAHTLIHSSNEESRVSVVFRNQYLALDLMERQGEASATGIVQTVN